MKTHDPLQAPAPVPHADATNQKILGRVRRFVEAGIIFVHMLVREREGQAIVTVVGAAQAHAFCVRFERIGKDTSREQQGEQRCHEKSEAKLAHGLF